jgi:hypothetical protein
MGRNNWLVGPAVGAAMAFPLCAGVSTAKDVIDDEPAGMEIARDLKPETQAAIELHVTRMRRAIHRMFGDACKKRRTP